MKKSYEMDMCTGPLIRKLLMFSVPLILSGILQLLFNAADVVVVGKFSGSDALAALGSTGSLINLFVNVFIGFSIGTNVLVAQFFGAGKERDVNETVHTSVLLGILGGLMLTVLGAFLARPLLALMDTPKEVIDQAVLYMRIYFIGMPAMLVYNFGASILRAIGDTKRPFYYLLMAGAVNVVLNLISVIIFQMGVAGVGIATVVSQIISAGLILRCLVKSDGMYRLDLRSLKITRSKLFKIIRIGLPAGLQGAIFSISNVLIQSSVNSFGYIAMAGNTAAGNIEGFVYTSMNAIYQTALSFTSQNVGGGKPERIPKIMASCLAIVFVIGAVLGTLAYRLGNIFLGLYSPDPEVISFGIVRLKIICQLYLLCGLMDTMVGVLRGMGYSLMPMFVSLTGACGLRVLWIFTVFQKHRSLLVLYLSYPITWAVTLAVHLICFAVIWKRKNGMWAKSMQQREAV